MTTPRALVLVLAGLAAAACSSNGRLVPPTEPRVAIDREFTLGVGEAAAVADTGVVLRMDAVADDSRCPIDVQCVWEGDAPVRVTAIGPRDVRATYDLHVSRGAREIVHEGLKVRLVRLDPAPRSGRSPAPADYRATLVVAD